MKQIFTFLLFTNYLMGQSWFQISDFPDAARDDGIGVAVNNKAYFGLGLKVGWILGNDIYGYDVNTNQWAAIAPFPAGKERQYASAFSGTDCFYVFGGDAPSGAYNDLYKYNISTNTWTVMASKPGIGLKGTSVMRFGDKVIIAGGVSVTEGAVSNEVWEYTMSTNSWLQKNNFPFGGRWRASAAVLNNSGYLCHGRDNNYSFRKELYKYIPLTDTWTKVNDFPGLGRSYVSLQSINNKLILFGGQDTTGAFHQDVWYYNETVNAWYQGPSIPGTARRGDMSCVIAGNYYFTCGLGTGDTRLKETWMMDVPVGIKEFSENSNFGIFPNPVQSQIYLYITNASFQNRELTYNLMDMSGRQVKAATLIFDQGTHARIDVEELEHGIYFLKISDNTKLLEVVKLIKD